MVGVAKKIAQLRNFDKLYHSFPSDEAARRNVRKKTIFSDKKLNSIGSYTTVIFYLKFIHDPHFLSKELNFFLRTFCGQIPWPAMQCHV